MLTIALMLTIHDAANLAAAETNLALCREEAAITHVDADDLCAKRRAELDAMRARGLGREERP